MVKDENEATKLGIFGRERAFYDALIREKSAQKLLNDETLKLIARELKEVVEEYASTDWANKQAPHRTKSTSLSKRQPALKTAPHAPCFTIAKN